MQKKDGFLPFSLTAENLCLNVTKQQQKINHNCEKSWKLKLFIKLLYSKICLCGDREDRAIFTFLLRRRVVKLHHKKKEKHKLTFESRKLERPAVQSYESISSSFSTENRRGSVSRSLSVWIIST